MNTEQIQARIEQLECLVLKQEAVIKDQQQHQMQLQNDLAGHAQAIQQQKSEYENQILQMQSSLASQQHQQHQRHQLNQGIELQQYTFGLDPHQVLNQFHQIRPFGKGHHLSLFIKSVENAVGLCNQNAELLRYGIAIIKNEKLIGDAAKTASLLPEDSTWDKIKHQLKKDFGPKKGYAEVFNYCRNIKIKTLRELFSIFFDSKFELNEIFLLDEEKPQLYEPQNVDRDLTEILITKIDGQFRACIMEHNPDIESLFNRFSHLRLLDDTRTIDYRHKRAKTQIYKNNNESQSNYPNKHYSKGYTNKQNLNKMSTNSIPNKYIQKNQSISLKNLPVPMELGNLEDGQEVNFLEVPRNQNYP